MENTNIENDNLNKTMKIKRNENIFVSVRRADINTKRTNKHYLTPTASSINKTTQKFIDRPSSSNTNLTTRPLSRISLSKTTPTSSRREKINTRALSKSQNCIVYYDNLHHFDCSDDLAYDPYGHFS